MRTRFGFQADKSATRSPCRGCESEANVQQVLPAKFGSLDIEVLNVSNSCTNHVARTKEYS